MLQTGYWVLTNTAECHVGRRSESLRRIGVVLIHWRNCIGIGRGFLYFSKGILTQLWQQDVLTTQWGRSTRTFGVSTMANIFMAHLEPTLMNELKSIGVCEWHRYVDDTFVRVQPGTNGFHPSIKLTYELEADDSLRFLDGGVTHLPEPHTYEMSIYRKPTFIGLMIYWSFSVPL